MKTNTNQLSEKPFFMDVTLRDGNQALKRPWNIEQKIDVFRNLVELGVQGVEAGFASASSLDFEACKKISEIAPENVTVSSLSRAVKREIELSWSSIQGAIKPRIHIVFPVSPYAIENILGKSIDKAAEMARDAVEFACSLSNEHPNATVQFSGEHLGECAKPDGFELTAANMIFQAAVEAGANVINLPNTVERYRPFLFTKMVRQIRNLLPGEATLSVHNHNDLGMAVATTVESYFAGAMQLEVCVNGLGERAGNTSLIETAIALHNCGIDVPLNFSKMFEVSNNISKLSGIEIHEKTPVIGADITSHRSGIHQDGVRKTTNKSQGLYRPFDFDKIGRPDSDIICFTSQSGKSAIIEILKSRGLKITEEEAKILQPVLKEKSENSRDGQLLPETIEEVFRDFIESEN